MGNITITVDDSLAVTINARIKYLTENQVVVYNPPTPLPVLPSLGTAASQAELTPSSTLLALATRQLAKRLPAGLQPATSSGPTDTAYQPVLNLKRLRAHGAGFYAAAATDSGILTTLAVSTLLGTLPAILAGSTIDFMIFHPLYASALDSIRLAFFALGIGVGANTINALLLLRARASMKLVSTINRRAFGQWLQTRYGTSIADDELRAIQQHVNGETPLPTTGLQLASADGRMISLYPTANKSTNIQVSDIADKQVTP